MKNAILYCAVPAYYRMCSTDVYCSKQTSGNSTKTITIISSFLELGRRENCRCSQKFVAAQKIFVKTETQQTFVNGLLGFITLGIYTPLEARVYCSQ